MISIDKLLNFLEETSQESYYPAIDNVMELMNIGILDAYLLQENDLSMEVTPIESYTYGAKDRSFDRSILASVIQ